MENTEIQEAIEYMKNLNRASIKDAIKAGACKLSEDIYITGFEDVFDWRLEGVVFAYECEYQTTIKKRQDTIEQLEAAQEILRKVRVGKLMDLSFMTPLD